METGDIVRAWRLLRRNRHYRKAWLRRLPPPGFPEPAPFALRLQTATDLAAARFGLLAWQNPFARDGPVSPFWAEALMADAMAVPDAVPLVGMAAAGEAEVAGLRIGDGTLVLKIERYGAAVQVWIRSRRGVPRERGTRVAARGGPDRGPLE